MTVATTSNNSSKSWRVHYAETILPFRFILIPLLCIGLWDRIVPNIPTTEPTIECKIPDLCESGFAPLDVLNWYEFIGSDGRLLYLGVVAFDLCLLMPLYSSVLFLELYLALPDHLSDTIVPCLPWVMTAFDLIETNTHGYATLMVLLDRRELLPSESFLGLVSFCTRAKFMAGGMSFAAIALFRVLKLLGVWAKPKEE